MNLNSTTAAKVTHSLHSKYSSQPGLRLNASQNLQA